MLLSEESWDAVVDVNLKGVWTVVKAAVPSMIERGAGGSIVITSSTAGLRGAPLMAHYVASKTGVVGLARHWRSSWAGTTFASTRCTRPASKAP
jgi:NAD(P)-dependent dehydrogenase (short-subunit alcohol dehydrogenase family)